MGLGGVLFWYLDQLIKQSRFTRSMGSPAAIPINHDLLYGVKTVEPVVLRPSRSRWAWAASDSA